jgi:hypothetical protein
VQAFQLSRPWALLENGREDEKASAGDHRNSAVHHATAGNGGTMVS